MAKKSKPDLADDPDLMPPKLAHDEIESLNNPVVTPPVVTPPVVTPPPPPPPTPVPDPIVQPAPLPPQSASAPSVTVVDINNNNGMNNGMGQAAFMQTQATVQAQSTASVGLAQTNIDDEVVKEQMSKEQEHWVKAYWRPAMGWLYMLICLCDFVIFPAVAMFLPVFFKGLGVQMAYTAWVSLTLSNGGLIHMAFGAILGVAAYGRTQEKVAARN
jgi:hypothetical protein